LRVLYIASSFPKPNEGATIYTDLAEALLFAGHDITVAVSEQARNMKRTEMKRERGFDVLRVVTGNYYDVSFIEKGITSLKIPMLMRKQIEKHLGNRMFDLILFEAPPVTTAGLITWAKKQFGCQSYLMLKDIFPQNAVDLGILKNKGLVFRYFKAQEKKLYQTADYIGCMSSANNKYLLDHNFWLDSRKIELFPNTKKVISDIAPHGFPMREKYGISKDACIFLFGGNMGRPQCVDLLCETIKECKSEAKIFFFFVGRGTDRYKLEKTININKIENAIVLDNLPRDEYEQITKECNIGLIVLDPHFTIPNYPSRILSYMEYEKPVLAATDKVSDIKELIIDAQCGEWIWSGNTDNFVNKVKEMANMTDLHTQGKKGRRYLELNFSIERSVTILENHFDRKNE